MRGGEAVALYVAAYERRFGFQPVIQTPDAIQLNRAYKIAGESFPKLVEYFLKMEDRFLEQHGWCGRMLTAPVINAWRLSVTKRPAVTSDAGASYRKKLKAWERENCLEEMPSLPPLAPLPPARTDG